ncbi:MAG: DUF2164 domain-containing protein [Verrucomicrobiota bacterium]
MSIELSKEEIRDIIPSIQRYIREEFDEEIGEMRAGFILEYFLKEVGPYAYNKGVKDAEQFFREKVEDLSGTCYEPGLTYWTKKKKSS